MNFADIKYKANYYVLLMLAFVIPLERRLIAPFIILFFVTCLFNIELKKKKKPTVLLFTIIYILYLIGLIYTDNFNIGLLDVTTKLSLFILPLCFFLSKIDFKKILNKVFKSFIEGCFVSVVIALINSTINYYYSFDTSFFFYGNAALFVHSSYLAMLLSLCLIVLYYFVFEKNIDFKFKPTISIFLLIFFSFFIILLSSKTGLITMLMIHLTAISIWVIKYKAYVKGLSLLMLLIISFSVTYKFSNLFKQRIDELATIEKSNQEVNSSTIARKIIWSTAIDIIMNEPLLGYGTGDAKDVLVDEYKNRGLIFLADKKLNTHNQFLQTTIAIGVVGGLILITMFILPGIISFRKKHYLYLAFLVIIVINFFTESMLERQVGVVFYAFFNSLFFVSYYSKPIIEK
jgi:O-antigen ligase